MLIGMRIFFISTFTLTLLHGLGVGAAQAVAAELERNHFFEHEVRPLLVAKCVGCHGSTAEKGGLRLDSHASWLAGGDTGAIVSFEQPHTSRVLDAINYRSLQMPPDDKLTDPEIEILTRWVGMGIPWPRDVGGLRQASEGFTSADRSYWALQPLADHNSEEPDNGPFHNSIDSYIQQRLRSAGQTPTPAASRSVLLRRLYYDLWGLPPGPLELAEFEKDGRPDATGRLVDRLLSQPYFGEKWARHWLDLVRYSESDGYKQDALRPEAWRYRDYVIRAMNADKPYDRFVLEQLAGDELEFAGPDGLVATSFLRHWIYEYNQRDVITQWRTILNDITDVTADVFLGLGFSCARCHDHKFDPILQVDYYRLQAFFTPLLPRDDLPFGTGEELQEFDSKRQRWVTQTATLRHRLAEIERPIRLVAEQESIARFPPRVRPMLLKPATSRTPYETQIAALAYRQIEANEGELDIESQLAPELKQEWITLRDQLAEYDHAKPRPLPPAFTVTDVGLHAPPTRIPEDPNQTDILPGFLSLLSPESARIPRIDSNSATTGRRTALARWIAEETNPLTTRVIANRLWQYHFGRGLVPNASDFGQLGGSPSHPALLDWLATELVHSAWSLKHLHRKIVSSHTYQQATQISTATASSEIQQGEEVPYASFGSKRLDAEQIRDAMLFVSGELVRPFGGPSFEPSVPCRSIYLRAKRNQRDALLSTFDLPDGFASVAQRDVTTIPPQALFMMNNSWSLLRAEAFAERLLSYHPGDLNALIRDAYERAFSRPATENERIIALEFLRDGGEVGDAASPFVSKDTLLDFCHVLLNSNEFIYVD